MRIENLKKAGTAVLAGLATAPFLADGQAHAGRDLLGAQEIFMRGVLEIHEEHLFTESLQRVLRGAIAAGIAMGVVGSFAIYLV